MTKYLTIKERENLLDAHRRERDKRICDRIKAVLAYDDGYSYTEIAGILLLDDETIRRHIKDYLGQCRFEWVKNTSSWQKCCQNF